MPEFNKNSDPKPTYPLVLFDSNCLFCRQFALFADRIQGKSGLTFKAWQDFYGTDYLPPKLRILSADGQLDDEHAWTWLLQTFPIFQPLNWLGSRIGIAPTNTGSAVHSTTSFLRKLLCKNCA